jgi:hypothetical protein
MDMRHRIMALAFLSLLVSSCYRVTVETGAAHAPTRIDRPWQMSFAAGLVPPPEIDTQADCPQGVAVIQTQRSFVNSLATGVTANIISPMDVRIVCAAGPVPR